MFKTVYNSTDSPVVVDEAGHSVGGHEWGSADVDEDLAKQAIEAGSLIVQDKPSARAEISDSARAAHERTAKLAGGKPIETKEEPAK